MREDFKSIRRLRYALPAVVNPAESVCIQVNVPNDLAYIGAFWGQMFALTRWYAWLPDSAHTGKDVAARWRDVYEQARESECQNVILRTSPVNDCLLQVSYDGGTTWETPFNAYSCALKAANDEFGSHSDQPAGHSQPGEQPGGANPQPGQCWDLDLTVFGNSMFLIPIAVASGWTLKLTEVKGAWWDGDVAHYWQCPDGHQFALGTCTNNQLAGISTDPLPTVNHMRLILRLADGTYANIPIDGSDYVVPAGQPAGNYFLLSNDTPLSDNQGSVALHLLACNSSVVHLTYTWGTGPATVNIGDEFQITPTHLTGFGGFDIIDVVFSGNVNIQWIQKDLEARSQDAVWIAWGANLDSPKYQAGIDNGQPFTDFAGLAVLNTHKGEMHPGTRLAIVTGGTGAYTFKLTAVS